nr:glycosyltransferase family 2 protein [Acidithiobacillus sp. S30A2]
MATYNGERYVRELIQSILAQTYTGWRLMVHDDSSSDATMVIVEEFRRNNPEKIFIINDGISFGSAKRNFQHLLQISRSQYVMFCDQDDVWMDKKIEVSLDAMMAAEKAYVDVPIIVHTDLEVVDQNLDIISPSMFWSQRLRKNSKDKNLLFFVNNITGCTMLINKKAAELGHCMPEEAIMHDWWIGLKTLQAGGSVAFVDLPTIRYRQHQSNTIGHQKYGLRHVGGKIFNLGLTIENIVSVYRQARAAGMKMPFVMWVAIKAYYSINRLFY